ncbi:MAG: hypothetical protein DWI57_10230 [Chloroflexi bacterium]|nr:MAG: hypothetical protein DWI57_10230 [Chloroflexota bacterium]
MANIGYFLEYRYWESAVQLLKYQLTLKKMNRHFNRLSMFYYEAVQASASKIEREAYFEKRIASNLFYGLEQEFAVRPYLLPKSNLGLRRYKFLSYPMRLLYYSVGLYLVELSQEFLIEHKALHPNIHSWYGGNLAFNLNTKALEIAYQRVWYKPHYSNFRKTVRQNIAQDTPNKIVFHLDIQNYYDEIDVQRLLGYLTEFIKPSIQQGANFDAVTKRELQYFFEFLGLGRGGIPQTDNDIVSSYIGHLYMIFGDIFIEEEILCFRDKIKAYKVIRYMDDVYISIALDSATKPVEKETLIHDLASRISDCLYERLGLRLNYKTKVFWLSNPQELNELKKNLKKVSQNYQIEDEENDEHPVNKLSNIFVQLCSDQSDDEKSWTQITAENADFWLWISVYLRESASHFLFYYHSDQYNICTTY